VARPVSSEVFHLSVALLELGSFLDLVLETIEEYIPPPVEPVTGDCPRGKKYDTEKFSGWFRSRAKTEYRIIATESWTLSDGSRVNAGDRGGEVKKESKSLVHDGCSWAFYGSRIESSASVSGDAIVRDKARIVDKAKIFGSAVVSGNALVGGDGAATVYGNAHVYGNAQVDSSYGKRVQVYGKAEVYGDARVYENAKVYGNAEVNGSPSVRDPAYPRLRVYGTAEVYENAKVSDYAEVYGNARVYGEDTIVRDEARVYGDAHVSGTRVRVQGGARVYGDSRVYDGAQVGQLQAGRASHTNRPQVFGNAQVYGAAQVYDNARVYGDAHVYDNAQVYGNARVLGKSSVCGDARVYGNAIVDYGNREWRLLEGKDEYSGYCGIRGDARVFDDMVITSGVYNGEDEHIGHAREIFRGVYDQFYHELVECGWFDSEYPQQTHEDAIALASGRFSETSINPEVLVEACDHFTKRRAFLLAATPDVWDFALFAAGAAHWPRQIKVVLDLANLVNSLDTLNDVRRAWGEEKVTDAETMNDRLREAYEECEQSPDTCLKD